MRRTALVALVISVLVASAPTDGRASEAGRLMERAVELVESNPAEARKLMEQAAAAGDPDAVNGLAMFMLRGVGESPDPAGARRLLEQAVAGGSNSARVNLAMQLMFEEERAGYPRAVALLKEAAKAPDSGWLALYPLGRMTLFGLGVEADVPAGAAMLEEAAARDLRNADAAFLAARSYQNGWTGRAADPVKAAQLFRRAADLGDPRGVRYYGAALLTGEGVKEDGLEAYAWFRKAAEAGDLMAMIDVAVMLATGEKGVPQNAAEARTWYQRAAELGSAHALRGFGWMLLAGEGGAPETARGLAYLEIAAEGGDPLAKTALGQLRPGVADRTAIDTAKQAWLAQHGPPREP